MKVIEVYPKIGCLVDGDPTGFRFTAAVRDAVKARIQGIADNFPGVTVDSWHLHADEGAVFGSDADGWFVQTPKAVVRFNVPDAATHAQIVQAFVDDGFWPWVKQGIRGRLPAGVSPTRWHGKLMTSMGRTQIDEAE